MESDIQTKMAELPIRVKEAHDRIKAHVWKTPLMFSHHLSAQGQKSQVYLKLENEQLTGSFKLRGAFNKLLLLKEKHPDTLQKGIVTASTGNHGIACIQAASTCKCKIDIFCQEFMSESKLAVLNAHGAHLTRYGNDCVEAETKARQTAQEKGQTYLSPYNDWDVAAGQGTIGYEIFEELPDVDCVLVSVGGGGLISGIASYLKHRNENIQVIGCQPRNSKVMYESVKAGQLVHEQSYDTLSDGTAGDIEDGAITVPVCCKHVDSWILVDEDQISDAVYSVLDHHHKVIEGAAGVAVAAYLANKDKFAGKKVVLVICGGNLSTATLRQIIDKH